MRTLKRTFPEPAPSSERAFRYVGPDVALDPWRERDACGVGFVAQASGARSHDVLQRALTAVARLAHRGAASNDKSGDGAGVLTQIPRKLFDQAFPVPRAAAGSYAIGMLFLPPAGPDLDRAISLVEEVLHECKLDAKGWRDVPVDPSVLAPLAKASLPSVRQVFVSAPKGGPKVTSREGEDLWERRLYVARKIIEQRATEAELSPFFVCSLSCRTVVYKALLTGTELPGFYPDLRSPLFETAIAVFHQRYSTNTLPSWPLAQPFHLLAHNGEINTLWGNRNAMRAREAALAMRGLDVDRIKPVIWDGGSDSTSLDNAMELLVRGGRDPVHALMMLVPDAWEHATDMDPAVRAFYEFHACLMEPWDGPAALAFTDGVLAGSALDRNGLRPCRYKITEDGLVIAASEVGVADLEPESVVENGRLGPGELLVVDTDTGSILRSAAARQSVAQRHHYAGWVERMVQDLPADAEPITNGNESDLIRRQRAFGYGFEDLRYVLGSMAGTGLDAVWSMGDDTPIPPLSRFAPTLYAYFRQRFAQVTNPAIDPLRETRVMSLTMYLGRRGSVLAQRPTPSAHPLLRLPHPILLDEEMSAVRQAPGFTVATVDAVWPVARRASGLKKALDALGREAVRAVRRGATILIISDRVADAARAPIPMLLAVGAVHQRLLATGLRTRVGLVAEAADAWDVHHFAALFGYGAEAVHPWLALESVDALEASGDTAPTRKAFRSASEKGLFKILSKMGISTLQSYAGAQIFEALGVGAEVIERCFTGTASVVGGIGFREIAEDVLTRHASAFGEKAVNDGVPDHGRVRFRKDGEDHGWSPPLVRAMQDATRSGNSASYESFVTKVEARGAAGPRDLLGLRAGTPVPIEEVEPVEDIRRRFISSAMSLGALSPETHSVLAIGMNRMGARSNSGEGGEDPETYVSPRARDRSDNRIKQVASGRFGVTTEYLVRADELEIKIAQGSKPGEGGQLPGHKVTALIARLRHAVPGIPLISPPPHHDIYSIEDLAQLIHDLKQVNPNARVGVKLVSEAGVGTVAAGVAKAYADYVLVSGHNGGTGASPLSSIKHAGMPWELGLAETQTILLENGLRERIEVRVDGGFRTGRDVVIGAALGAEAFGFGTASLVAVGCAMARQCHLNTCPTGIATQRPELREKFRGTPEQVVAYFTMLAEDVRRILASIGVRQLDDMIGRVELLERIQRPDTPRAALLDLDLLLERPAVAERPRRRTIARNVRPGLVSLDARIMRDLKGPLERREAFAGGYNIGNHHLSVGARIAGDIARRYGRNGPPRPVRLRFAGSAGQSFGAFTLPGMQLHLTGEANDHVGKGLCGGEIVVRPFRGAGYAGGEHSILGNTALYGATSGTLFAAGGAGDRFGVRNSGAVAVIEGAGDHCCEYMTGGVVVVLGRVGKNFGAGMTNGAAYVLDDDGVLVSHCNTESVALAEPTTAELDELLALIRRHQRKTGSVRALLVLERWAQLRAVVKKVAPIAVAATATTAVPKAAAAARAAAVP